MKKITLKSLSVLLLTLLIGGSLKAQSYSINYTASQQCWSSTGYGIDASITPTVPGAATYSWVVLGVNQYSASCPVTFSSVNGNSVNINFTCPGTYTVEANGLSSSNVLLSGGMIITNIAPPPSISISTALSNATVCPGALVTLTASGAATYTWSNGTNSSSTGFNASPSMNSMTVIGTASTGCPGSATYTQLGFFNYPNISITGPANGTVCQGSSALLTASGANSYTWTNPSATTSTVSVIAAFWCQQYTVTGTDSYGCVGTMTAFVCADSTCADVWPGDANSDGLVDNTDVLEIGFAYGQTGTARTPGGNSFTSQYASSIGWIGFGSTGKRKVHVDCNGDGTIDMGDTLAIYNNYSLTHTFKPSGTSSNNSDITLVTSNVAEGVWNKADIMLGSYANTISQLYGVVFDLNFDNSMIESNSAYIVYSPSFLNASNSNVQFRKTNFASGKVYAASVRTNGSNVSGDGKIGEFWFKVKTGTVGSTLNLSTSNSKKIGVNKIKTVLADGSTAATIVAATVGIKENTLQNATSYFPNPASNQVTFKSSLNTAISYSISDIIGREIKSGSFINSATLDVSAFQNGSYLIRLETGFDVTYKKLVIEK